MNQIYDLLQMIKVEPGTFMMGSPPDSSVALEDEVQREVILSRPFEMGRFPVTNLVWDLVMDKPLDDTNLFLPKIFVSWVDTAKFCQKLNEQLGLPQSVKQIKGKWAIDLDSPGFRLPTEAEWEYTCRAGTQEDCYGPIDDIAWHEENSGYSTQPIGLKLSNAWGFYDTLGNVWEWCWDRHDEELLGGMDPTGPNTGSKRVLRGSSWLDDESLARAAWRANHVPGFRDGGIGFRLARTLPNQKI
jgi:formylglycine-generating enzyme required for sulfatase activity